MSTPRPNVRKTKMNTPTMVERTVRNLIHSDLATDISVTSLLMVHGLDLSAAKFNGARGQLHEHVFERGALGREFEHGDARSERRPANFVTRELAHRQFVI